MLRVQLYANIVNFFMQILKFFCRKYISDFYIPGHFSKIGCYGTNKNSTLNYHYKMSFLLSLLVSPLSLFISAPALSQLRLRFFTSF